jgi:rSAM/selenodomain-associated transferase 2
MLSVVIPTFNAAEHLPRTLNALIGPTVRGLIKEVILTDGGSTDATEEIAEATGAKFVVGEKGRGPQLAAGAEAARGEWLLFLHADTYLDAGWEEEVASFLSRRARSKEDAKDQAGVFRFALDAQGGAARRVEWMVSWRCALLALPYGDQGLLISRAHYDRIGGFKPLPLMEDVDIVRRIGRKGLVFFRSHAVTSAERYEASGYWLRPLRNMSILVLYFLRVPTSYLVKLYG